MAAPEASQRAVGQWLLSTHIGAGSFAVVWKARHAATGGERSTVLQALAAAKCCAGAALPQPCCPAHAHSNALSHLTPAEAAVKEINLAKLNAKLRQVRARSALLRPRCGRTGGSARGRASHKRRSTCRVACLQSDLAP